jgi:ABC-type multidrug transport system fused ATPase/permease subunit
MEFFIPGLLIFIVSILVTWMIAPRITPMIGAILAIVFLTYGVYDHYKMFADEYRLSTWHEGLRLYAPAIMILAIILFLIFGVLTFFTSGSVPVPSLPAINMPSANTATNAVVNAFNNVANSISDVTNSLIENNGSNRRNRGNNEGIFNNLVNNVTNSLNKAKTNVSKSFLETV